jgi:nitrate reductase NapAB chaperone NapD
MPEKELFIVDKEKTLENIEKRIKETDLKFIFDVDLLENIKGNLGRIKNIAGTIQAEIVYENADELVLYDLTLGKKVLLNVSNEACEIFGVKHGKKLDDVCDVIGGCKVIGVGLRVNPKTGEKEKVLWCETEYGFPQYTKEEFEKKLQKN